MQQLHRCTARSTNHKPSPRLRFQFQDLHQENQRRTVLLRKTHLLNRTNIVISSRSREYKSRTLQKLDQTDKQRSTTRRRGFTGIQFCFTTKQKRKNMKNSKNAEHCNESPSVGDHGGRGLEEVDSTSCEWVRATRHQTAEGYRLQDREDDEVHHKGRFSRGSGVSEPETTSRRSMLR